MYWIFDLMSINPYLFFLLINFFVLLSAQLIHLLLLYIVQLNLFFNEEDTVFEIRNNLYAYVYNKNAEIIVTIFKFQTWFLDYLAKPQNWIWSITEANMIFKATSPNCLYNFEKGLKKRICIIINLQRHILKNVSKNKKKWLLSLKGSFSHFNTDSLKML